MDLEAQRLENLLQKQKLLAELNLQSHVSTRSSRTSTSDTKTKPPPVKRRKLEILDAPARTSARLASSGVRPSYKEDGGEKWNYIERENTRKKKGTRSNGRANDEEDEAKIASDLRSLVPVADVDTIIAGWTSWESVADPPTRDDTGSFYFDDFPTFTPNKSPEEMLREGSFGGSYFRPLKSKRLGVVVQDDWNELPVEWIDGLDISRYLISPVYDADANKFKVACGQSIEEWEAAGWIAHEFDVRGWFQWYCRFWMGRRCDDDARQVSRWAKCVGARGRWRRLLLKKYVQMGVRDVFDDGDEEDEDGESKQVSPVMHQTCHHWAYEVRQGDLDDAWTEFR